MPILSAFETRTPLLIGSLASHLDDCGYERLWLTEHHTPLQSGSPTVAAAIAASRSTTLRIGTLGLKLRYHNPLRVAKDFHLLECYFPNRIDLGVVDGPLGNAELEQSLVRGCSAETFRDVTRELVTAVRSPQDALAGETIFRSSSIARLWIGSASHSSAELAGALGLGFAFHLPLAGPAGLARAADVIKRYRDHFVGGPSMPQPQVAIVCFGQCLSEPLPSQPAVPYTQLAGNQQFLGSPEQVREQLECLAVTLQADEVAIQCLADSEAAVMSAYERVACAFGMQRRSHV